MPRRLVVAAWAAFGLLLPGCAATSPTPQGEPTAAAPTGRPTPRPPEPTSTLPPLSGAPADEAAVATLTTRIRNTFPPTPSPAPARRPVAPALDLGWAGGLVDTRAVPFDSGASGYWTVYSLGARSDGADAESNFVAVYARVGNGWRQVDTIDLDCPDRLENVEPVTLAPDRRWLLARGRADVHDRCFDVVSFDGEKLEIELSHRTPGPNGSALRDIDGDGVREAVIDLSDPYVLCYTCGVQAVSYEIRTWADGQWTPIRLTRSREDRLRPTDRAVALAQAGLWKDAAGLMRRLGSAERADPAVAWDAHLIELIAAGRAQHARTSGYPLLAHVLYGDYPAAVALMRRHDVPALFGPRTPLVTGTPAQAWRARLSDWLERAATTATLADSQLAPAYFVRGWARHLVNPASLDAIRDLKRASTLAPDEMLYRDSAAFLETEQKLLNRLRPPAPDA